MSKITFIESQSNVNYDLLAEVEAENENQAEQFLELAIEDEMPQMGWATSHFNENGKWYFKVTEDPNYKP